MENYSSINWRENPLDCNSDEWCEDLQSSYINKVLEGQFDVSSVPHLHNATLQHAKVPGHQYYLQCPMKSKFNTLEHGMLISALNAQNKSRVNFHEKQDVEFYNTVKLMLNEETAKFQHTAEDLWNKTFGMKPLKIKPEVLVYAKFRWGEKCKHVKKYARLYNEIDKLSYSYSEADTEIEMVHLEKLLSIGSMAKFYSPEMTSQYFLKAHRLPCFQVNIPSFALPVSEDHIVAKLLENNEVDCVISLSALKCLIDFTHKKKLWTMPMRIKETFSNEMTSKKIIYIDKPFVNQHPTKMELNAGCAKLNLRTHFCKVTGFRYPTPDGFEVSEDEAEEHEQFSSDEEFGSQKSGNPRPARKYKLIHNATYSVWKLGQKFEGSTLMKNKCVNREFRVLVRTKVDACDMNESCGIQPITVVPKLEFQLDYGCNISTKSELINQWTSLFFKPNSQLRRVRMQYYSSEVIKIDNCNIQTINQECVKVHGHRPQLGLGVLYKILYEAVKCPGGNYLMRHEPKYGAFVALLQETTNRMSTSFDLHETYENECSVNESSVQPWCPIDTNILTPKFEAMGHMPGLFKPREIQQQTVGIRRKGAKKKKKKGNNKSRMLKNNVRASL